MRKQLFLAAAVMGLWGCSEGPLVEVTVNPDAVLQHGMTARQLLEARRLNFKDLGGAYKSVGDQLDTARPNLTLIQLAASDVKNASSDLLGWFTEGTGLETGLETAALPRVWQEWDNFVARANAFRTEATRLAEITQAGDFEAIAAQNRAVGQACKACHDQYRADDD